MVIPRYNVGFRDILELLEFTENNNFDSVWVTDHLQSSRGRIVLESWSILSAVAAITRKIRLGTVVLCYTYRHPSVLAKMVATLDNISGGRVELGLGIGSQQQYEEHRALGIDFPVSKHRREQFREYVEVVKLLMSCHSKINYQGKYYSLYDADCNCPTIQKPHPPIWVGARKKGMIKIAAEIGEGWNFYGESIEEFENAFSEFIKICDSIGKSHEKIRKSIFTSIFTYENIDEKRIMLESIDEKVESEDLFIRRTNTLIYGSVDECIEKIDRLEEKGVELIILRDLTPNFQNLRRFSTQVMPSFSKKT